MTEKWFIEDIKKLMQHRQKVVLLDPHGQCEFLLPILEKNHINVLKTDATVSKKSEQEKEELFLRYEAETTLKGQDLVFYITRPQDKLSFLFDYSFTHGCLDLSHPQEWLKKKIFTNTGLQVQLDNPMLLTAAKSGIGKDLSWWKKIVQDLEEIINLNEELLPFVHNPDDYLKAKDETVKRLFEEKLHELLGQPYLKKSPQTLADEVVKKMLDGLVYNEISETLLELYYKWTDSATFKPSLETYIRKYKIAADVNPWNAHPDHCFEKLDQKAIRLIADNIRDKNLILEKLEKLHSRIFSTKNKNNLPDWWHDVWTLFHAETKVISTLGSLNAVIAYYTETFSKIDRAIRNLYEVFLNEVDIIRPLQEYYEDLNHLLLQTWFGFIKDYQPGQQGYIPALLSKANAKTAIIVGDGLRYEIADFVASELQKYYKVDKQVMLADMPSETEHNMSALYVGGNQVLALQKDREAKLTKVSGKNISYLQLEQLNYGTEADFLVLTYKDIDSAGEKLQQAAIKLFSEFEKVLIEKITLLMNMGFQEVYLVSDHGFVLTGLLDEASKIEPSATGKKEVHERFIRTVENQTNLEWLMFEKPYGEFNYVYAAKSQRPFKSKGVYGFAHGGFTPQEIIIPKFKFSNKTGNASVLEVLIANKQDLKDVPSELFIIRLDAPKASSGLFGNVRKIQIKLFADKSEYQSSDIFNIESDSVIDKEFSFNGNSEVQAVLLDAVTQEQLDTAIIKKSNLRDLGGLL